MNKVSIKWRAIEAHQHLRRRTSAEGLANDLHRALYAVRMEMLAPDTVERVRLLLQAKLERLVADGAIAHGRVTVDLVHDSIVASVEIQPVMPLENLKITFNLHQ